MGEKEELEDIKIISSLISFHPLSYFIPYLISSLTSINSSANIGDFLF